jgi:hypothetical protein
VPKEAGSPDKVFALRPGDEFFNFHNHDFVRVAVAAPLARVADPEFNAG